MVEALDIYESHGVETDFHMVSRQTSWAAKDPRTPFSKYADSDAAAAAEHDAEDAEDSDAEDAKDEAEEDEKSPPISAGCMCKWCCN